MRPRIHVTPGEQYGRWTVLYESARRVTAKGYPKRYVRCQCACGWQADIQIYNLVHGRTRECQQCNGQRRRRPLAGQYGLWTVVGEAPPNRTARGNTRAMIHVRCACGRESEVERQSLRRELSRGCVVCRGAGSRVSIAEAAE